MSARLYSIKLLHRNPFLTLLKEIAMRTVIFVFALGFLALLLTGGSGAKAQIVLKLKFEGKGIIAGIYVSVQDTGDFSKEIAMVSGQSKFNIGDTKLIGTAGELMAVSEAGIRFLPSAGTDIGEVAVELGPETVFCLADGTVSKDWLAVGQSAVAVVPQEGGPAISVRNALWMYDAKGVFPLPVDPTCSNADYPVLATN